MNPRAPILPRVPSAPRNSFTFSQAVATRRAILLAISGDSVDATKSKGINHSRTSISLIFVDQICFLPWIPASRSGCDQGSGILRETRVVVLQLCPPAHGEHLRSDPESHAADLGPVVVSRYSQEDVSRLSDGLISRHARIVLEHQRANDLRSCSARFPRPRSGPASPRRADQRDA